MGIPVATSPVATREAAIFRMAMTGDKKTAIKKLYNLINECVADKDFQNAERLRERFCEIDPAALPEIIQSAEIIEQAKHGTIGRGYLEIWSDLFNELTAEEFSAIYYELEERSLQPEDILVSHGDKNDELFFINHGSLKVFYQVENREVFIKSLNSGEIAGENFFNASVWTVSLSALTPTRLSCLKRSSFIRWHEEFPGLKTKLQNFYNRFNDVHELLEKKKLNRRKSERFQLSRKVQLQMIDAGSKVIGREFHGRLSDISKNGLSLLIRIAKKENSRLLLGRIMRISIPTGGPSPFLQVQGRVLSVNLLNPSTNDFKMHFIFLEKLEQEALQTILG